MAPLQRAPGPGRSSPRDSSAEQQRQTGHDQKTTAGLWLFSDSFSSKSAVPEDIGDIDVDDPTVLMADVVVIRACTARKVLNALRSGQTTGPDRVGACILTTCSD